MSFVKLKGKDEERNEWLLNNDRNYSDCVPAKSGVSDQFVLPNKQKSAEKCLFLK